MRIKLNNIIYKGSVTKINQGKSSLQESYNDYLSDYLEKKIYESGKVLNQILVDRFRVTPENARQILKRAVSKRIIKSSKPYTFGKGQFAYIYNGHELDRTNIKSLSKQNRPPIYRLLEMMDLNNGIISYYEAMKITASPLVMDSTKVSSLDSILRLLSKLEIVYDKRDLHNVVYILYKYKKEELDDITEKSLMSDHYAKMVTDCSVLPDILRWLGNSNLITDGSAIYRNKKKPSLGAKHNNLVWDAFAYSKTTGINPILGAKADSVEKQTLTAIDIVLSGDYTQQHLDGFYNRIQININSVTKSNGKKVRKVLPIIVYRTAPAQVINRMGRLGFLAFEISAIFGKRIYEILSKTNALLSKFQESDNLDKTIKSILKSIDKAGQEDALGGLRGTLFEFLMYPLLSNIFPQSNIIRGKTISRLHENGDKEGYEYDYIIQTNSPPEIIIIELKGYHSGATISLGDNNTKSTLHWFFSRTLPFVKNQFKSGTTNGIPVRAVYITSANFYDDGKEFLSNMNKSKLKSTAMDTGYDRKALIGLLKEKGFNNEIKIIKRFYRKNESP